MAWIWIALGSTATMSIWRQSQPETYLLGALVLVVGAWAILRCKSFSTGVLVLFPVIWGLAQIGLGKTSGLWRTTMECCQWLTLLAVFAGCLLATSTGVGRRSFLAAAALFASVLCLFSTVQAFTSSGRVFWYWQGGEPQVFGPFLSRNNYASFMILMLPLVVARWTEGGKNGWAWLVAGGAMMGSVIASGSRAGTALVLGEAVVIAVLFLHKRALYLLLAAGLACLVFGWDHLASKVFDQDPFRYRKEMIQAALNMAQEQPFWGTGLGTFVEVYPAHARFDSGHLVNHAHNDWAEWAGEGGLPVVVTVGGFFLAVLGSLRKAPWGMGLVFVLLHSMVDYPMQRLGVMFWVVAIAAAVLSANEAGRSSRELPNTLNGFG